MQNKIRILMAMVERFERSIMQPLAKEEIIESILSHFMRSLTDQEWFMRVMKSFKEAILLHSVDPETWLANQLSMIGILEVSKQFQKNTIHRNHCMSFAFHFLNDHEDNFFCDIKVGIHHRITHYLKHASKILAADLKPGDSIIYNNGGYTHIALFVERINNTLYAVSKFGEYHNVFLHPIDYVPEHYGQAEYFSNNSDLSETAKNKFAQLSQELRDKMESCATLSASPTTILTQWAGVYHPLNTHTLKMQSRGQNKPQKMSDEHPICQTCSP